MKEIHIKIKRQRFFALLAMSLVMLILSALFVFMPSLFISQFISSKTIIKIFGIIGIFFFGISSIYLGRKLANSKLGLYISDKGILDKVSVFRFDWIEWSDIRSIEIQKIGSGTVICVYINDVEKYIGQLESQVFRKAAIKNYENYGTPIFINTKILLKSQREVFDLLNSEFARRS